MERNGVDFQAAQRILVIYGQPITRHRDFSSGGSRGQTGRHSRLPYEAFYLPDFRINLSLYSDLPGFIVLDISTQTSGRQNKYY